MKNVQLDKKKSKIPDKIFKTFLGDPKQSIVPENLKNCPLKPCVSEFLCV